VDADAVISSGFSFCCSAAVTTATMTADAAVDSVLAAAMAAKASSGSYSCSAAAAAATDSAKIRQRGGFMLPLSHKPLPAMQRFFLPHPLRHQGALRLFGYEACFRRIHNIKELIRQDRSIV
jgi:hypothetical protein